jgi:hypothetical protein
MKKIIFLVATIFLGIVTSFVGCKKEVNVETKKNEQNQKKLVKSYNFTHLNFTEKKETINAFEINNAFECNDNLLKILKELDPSVLQILFTDYPELKAYFIKLSRKYENYDTEVIILKNEKTHVNEVLLQKHLGSYTNGLYTGTYILEDVITGFEILHNKYENGKNIYEINHFIEWSNNTTTCKPNASELYFRNCTRAQFNAAYQQAKFNCESDFVCDLACSFNPCAISYIASAMIHCW